MKQCIPKLHFLTNKDVYAIYETVLTHEKEFENYASVVQTTWIIGKGFLHFFKFS